jgi:putative Holliday junction resolvase
VTKARVTVLAFDFGLNNIGVASGQTITRSAGAVTTLKARAGIPDWKAVDALLREWQPDVLLVGLPLNMDQTMSAMAERAKQFAATLRARYEMDVEMVDERLTSFEARGLSDDVNAQHAIAARLIAETYLNGDSLNGGS